MKFGPLVLLLMVLGSGCRTGKHSHRAAGAEPDFAALKVGMFIGEFQEILGVAGEAHSTGTPPELVVEFHLAGRYVVSHFAMAGNQTIITEFQIVNDGLSVADRRALRARESKSLEAAGTPGTNAPPPQTSQ